MLTMRMPMLTQVLIARLWFSTFWIGWSFFFLLAVMCGLASRGGHWWGVGGVETPPASPLDPSGLLRPPSGP